MNTKDTNPTKRSSESLPPVATEQPPTNTETPSVQQPPQPRRPRIGRQLLLTLIIALLAGIGGAVLYAVIDNDSEQLTSRQTSGTDGNTVITEEEENVSNLVAKVSPSVVSIVTESQAAGLYSRPGVAQGAGTGVIIGAEGYIMTNKHVIDGVDAVGVVLADGTRYQDVQVVGTDPLNDIAVLKINDVDDLPVAELGDSTSIRVGQKVVAIGNSLGQYQNTVTSGIISGTGRPVSAKAGDTVETLTDLIQTDAAINPGNSGGPLLNLQGQVIGINTAIAADAQGIGFAIPISATKGIIKGVLAGDGVQRAFLGIGYLPITPDVANEFNLSVKKGAYVYASGGGSAITPDSPAAKAGIKNKDIITKVGDIEVGDRGSVATLVAEYAPGDTIQLTILRGNKTLTLNATLSAYRS